MLSAKVVFIIKNLQGNGAEKYVLTLSKALHYFYNVQCHVVLFNDLVEYEVDESVNLHFVSLDGASSYKQKAEIIDKYVLSKIGVPDLALSNLTYSDKIMRHSTLDNVYHVIHSQTSIEHFAHKNLVSKTLSKLKLRRIYNCKPSICVSHGVHDDFLLNIKPKKESRVIYNPIDEAGLADCLKIKSDTYLPDEYILHVGKFNEAKRHDRLLRAYAHAKPECDLILLGKGHLMDTCKQLAVELNIENKVHFIGHLKNPYPVIKNATLFVLSSDFEGLPTVLLESIVLGVPTISVDCPSGPKEIFGDVYAHCLCNMTDEALAEKIKDAINDSDKYTPKLNEKFSMQHAATSYMKLIK